MLALALLSCLATDPSGASLGPGEPRSVVIADASGAAVASVELRPRQSTTVALPPGRYTVQGASSGGAPTTFTVSDGETTAVSLPGDKAPVPQRKTTPQSPPSPPKHAPERAKGPAAESSDAPPSWRRWGAPLLSAVVPGLGQAVNRQPGKAAGAFGGTVGLLAGAALVRPEDGSGANGWMDPGSLSRGDTAALAGFGVLAHAAAALYLAQLMDAHAAARGRPVRAHRDARVRVQVGRSTALAFAPGSENVALYADTKVAVLGRVSRRVSVGIADLGFKVAAPRAQPQVQLGAVFHGGVRSMVRLLDTRPRWMSRAGSPSRLWLLAGGGATLHTTVRTRQQSALQPEDPPRERTDDQTSVTLYALGEAHYFLLDRWSLALVPRLSVPMGTRHYAAGRALPRYAPTLELGLTLAVWL